MDEALLRVTGDQLAQLMFPHFDADAERTLLADGHERLARRGRRARSSSTPTRRSSGPSAARTSSWSAGRPTPTTCTGMVAARGILTSRGGKTSHAAVVARGMGRTCVCGAEALDVDVKAKRVHRARRRRSSREGDVISIDGTTGEVFVGAVPVSDSLVVRHFEGDDADGRRRRWSPRCTG